MALRLDYTVRETAKNVQRNVVITVASVLCVSVSLALVGFALMARQGVERATGYWQGDIQFIVWMNVESTSDQIEGISRSLDENRGVEDLTFFDQEAAYEEFLDLFADTPEMAETVTAADLPPSFRVVPVDKSPEAVAELVSQYQGQPGVMRVSTATEAIEAIQAISNFLTSVGLAVAVILLVVAVLIILTTIQLAIYTRRREIEVMRLVGASNSFIRIPFMLEGLLQGLVGAVLAIGALAIFKPFFEDSLPAEELPLFSELTFSSVEMFGTYLFLTSVGILVGTVAAAIAVSYFLDT
ncbi:MAG: FtsX-like permease family protein [Acidimicrobiia bacterium]|nr:FtsX-like permease family protein [Acidimicrobiia bacterium]